MGILDFVFPKKCVSCKKLGDYICSNCFAFISFNENSICIPCNRASLNGLTHPGCKSRYSIDGCFSSVSYNKIAKKLIYNFKYKPYLLDLKNVLVDLFYEGIIQNEEFNKNSKNAILVPVPLYSSKLKKRGYNQAEILANGISKKLRIEVRNLLLRTKNTKTQFSLGKKERKENMKGVFSLSSSTNLKGKTVFVIDDILTTGSTLSECANVLKRAGAKRVFGLTLAREQ